MNCLAFDRALDTLPETPLGAEAHAHAASCARCASALRRATALDATLRAHGVRLAQPPALRADFADRVLAQVQVRDARRAHAALPAPWPWWAEAIWQPATVLALTVFALWFVASDPATASGGLVPAALARLATFFSAFGARLAPGELAPEMQATLAIVVLLCVLVPPAWLAGVALQRLVADGVAARPGGVAAGLPRTTTT